MAGHRPGRALTAYLFDRADRPEPAFTHLDYSDDPGGRTRTLSWAELATRVRATAARVAELSASDARVAVLARQELDYVIDFLAVLHAGRVAVPLFAPENSRNAARLVTVLSDCEPELWLTSNRETDRVRAFADDNPVPRPKQIFAAGDVDPATGGGFVPDTATLDAPAYLQYTSGSTRSPAGAVISHRAATSNAWQASTALGVQAGWTCAGWIPFFHDMGLLQLVLLPVHSGARSVFMAPFDFIAKPARWLHQLSNYSDVLTAAPNFAYDYAARKVGVRDRATLDLSGVRMMINGSEPVQPGTIDRFDTAFGPCGLAASAQRPSYGLAEATVFVASTREPGPVVTTFDRVGLAHHRAVAVGPGHPQGTALVASGIPYGQHVCITDPETRHALADGTVGEVWIHGPNVADGYWRQPQRTAETFDATLLDPPDGLPARGWLRSGDLGTWHDGMLYVTGRIKDLIIIDGTNHYPQDIEITAAGAHEAIRSGHVAAFSVPDADGAECAVVVAEVSRPVEPGTAEHDEVAVAVRRTVNARHGLGLRAVVLVSAGNLPRTSSGKIARAATRDAFWTARHARADASR